MIKMSITQLSQIEDKKVSSIVKELFWKYRDIFCSILNWDFFDEEKFNDQYWNLIPELQEKVNFIKSYVDNLLLYLSKLEKFTNFSDAFDFFNNSKIEVNRDIFDILLKKAVKTKYINILKNDKRFSKYFIVEASKEVTANKKLDELYSFIESTILENDIVWKNWIDWIFDEIAKRLKSAWYKRVFSRKEILDAYFEVTSWKDVFLKNPFSHPKMWISSYLSEQWLRDFQVPRYTLNQLEKVISNWETIIVRSEHVSEYSWESGIFDSFLLNKEILDACSDFFEWKWIDDIDLNKRVYYDKKRNISFNRYQLFYCLFILWIIDKKLLEQYLFNISKTSANFLKLADKKQMLPSQRDDFIKWLNHSYWKYEKWFNISIVLDSSVKERFHIIISWTFLDIKIFKYFIYEQWNLVFEKDSFSNLGWLWLQESMINKFFNKSVLNLIKTYKKVVNTPWFNPTHCPVIELQLLAAVNLEEISISQLNFNDLIWDIKFLQYHRLRDFDWQDEANLTWLDNSYVRAEFVRWVTKQWWEEFEFYVNNISWDNMISWVIWTIDHTMVQVKIRDTKCFLDISNYDFASSNLFWHWEVSSIFKSNLYVKIRWKIVFNWIEDLPEKIICNVISDWKRAFIKVLTPWVRIEKT